MYDADVRVAVGSGNPAKRRAVERVLPAATVEAIPVESGVPEQPRGRADTVRGAVTRARRALAAGAYDYGIGVEGGVATAVDGIAADGTTADGTADDGAPASGGRDPDRLYLVMWAAVTDGDRTGRGGGPTFELPDRVARRVRDGEELGPVMDDVLGTEGVAREQGAAGVFTGGRLARDEALAAAVTAACGPFVCDLYD